MGELSGGAAGGASGGAGEEATDTASRSAATGRLFRVEGRVQGVGYRAFARATADALGVAGWTCNLGDGSVAVAAAVDEATLPRLVARLRVGPPGAVVSGVRDVGPVELAADAGFIVLRRPPANAVGPLGAA